MKCPKCGYNSFDHLDSCKKCGQSLTEHKAKFNLRSFFAPGQPVVAEPVYEAATDYEEEPPTDEPVDFGFDFLDEEENSVGKAADESALDVDHQSVSIDQPFGVDSESIPADTPAFDDEDDPDDKPGKGPEFAF